VEVLDVRRLISQAQEATISVLNEQSACLVGDSKIIPGTLFIVGICTVNTSFLHFIYSG